MIEIRGQGPEAARRRDEKARAPENRVAVVNPAALADLIDMNEAIELVDEAMRQLSAGGFDAPQRWQVPVSSEGIFAIMPGVAPMDGHYGVKLLSLYENAAAHGLPGHQGVMLLFDRSTGRILSIIEANALTRLRTAAASAVATRALARADASTMALLGCGEQAKWHAQSIPLVRPIEAVRLWGRSPERARAFADQNLGHVKRVDIVDNAEAAVRGADIICTTTHAKTPIVDASWLTPGQHINLVGASTKNEQEIDGHVVSRGMFFVDARAHALAQAGELIEALEKGWVEKDSIQGEIGELLGGSVVGRQTAADITVYKSLGHVAQDLAVASAIQARIGQSPLVARVAF